MATKTELLPILVVVADGQYNCFGLGPTPTPRDAELFNVLQDMGGVNESVEDGRWHFNVVPMEDGTLLATLYPATK